MTVDLTGVATALIAGVFSVLAIVLPLLISSRMKDRDAAATLSAAVRNSLGAIQQASTMAVQQMAPSVQLKGVSPELAAGVQYVLSNAGPEAERLGITPQTIASKISAQIGLAQITTNQAVAASPLPLIPDPLGPVPVSSASGPQVAADARR